MMLRYYGMTVRNNNEVHNEIKRRITTENAIFVSVQNPSSSQFYFYKTKD
jgi:hypothetical protein